MDVKAVLAVVAATAALTAPGAARSLVPAHGVTSVALAGSHVAWVHAGSLPDVYRDGKLIWRAPVVPPPDVPPGLVQSPVVQTAIVSASATTVAVLRTALVWRGPACLHAVPPCLAASFEKKLVGDVWAGPPQGPLRRVAGDPETCVTAIDVSGKFVAAADGACASTEGADRLRVISEGGRTVFERSLGATVDEVALSWPYVAWYWHGPAPAGGVVVADLRSKRMLYQLDSKRLFTNNPPGLDVQSNAVVGLVVDRPPLAAPCATNQNGVAWASPRERRLHFVASRAWASDVRIGRGRLVFMRAASCDSTEAQLAMARLTGRGRTLVLCNGPFDFDGRRLAWAAADGIHVARVP